MSLSTYHCHTTFCDGRDTPENMVIAAVNTGMTDIGFSAHAMWPFATEWHLSAKRYGEYLAEINRLKSAYDGRINIFAGFEVDYLRGVSAPDPAVYGRFKPDYLIGSVHYVRPASGFDSEGLWSTDAPTDEVRRGLDACFGGDGKRAIQSYWAAVREMVTDCRFDIIGHLDVIRKRNGELRFFDESAAWYRAELKATAKAVARSGKIVELNTGGIARKAIDSIYPSDELLSLLGKHGVPITICSDAHSAADLTCAYDRARAAARKAGFTTLSRLTATGWIQEAF